MADGALSRNRARLTDRFGALPLALRVALIYLSARVVTTAFLLAAAALSVATGRFGPDATIASFVMGWDAEWYGFIAAYGYPSELPRDETGMVGTNQWAFMPLYPLLANLLGLPFGQYAVGALLVSLAAGYGAALVLYHLLRERIGDGAAMWAVVFFSAGPVAALFQVGYAEALFLLWLFLALRCLQTRRYGWLYLLIPVMGYTRPGVLAFSLLLALYGIHRWFTRRTDPLPPRDVVHIVATGLLAAVVGFSWQFIAGWVTGEPSGYLETELAWRRSWTGESDGGFVPFDGFVRAAALWFRLWGMPEWWGYVFLAALVLGAALVLFLPAVRRLGIELRLWWASYLVYLLAVFFPQSSIFRLLVPLSPIAAGALAQPRSTLWRLGVVTACLIGQWWWIYSMYALASTYYQIP